MKNKFYMILALALLILPQAVYAISAPVDLPGVPKFDTITNPEVTVGLLPSIINLLLNFATAIAIIFLIFGGYLFVTSRGEEDQLTKAKNIITYSVAGLAIMTFARILPKIFLTPVEQPNTAFDQVLADNTLLRIIEFGQFLLGTVAVLFLVFAGYLFVTARGEEDQVTKAKHSLGYGIAGLVTVVFARVITTVFFAPERANVVVDTVNSGSIPFDTPLAETSLQTFINFGQLLMGAVAVLFIVIAGYYFITARGEEDQVTKAKHSLGYAAVGLMAVVLSEVIVRTFYNADPSDPTAPPSGNLQLGLDTLVSITNSILAFVGVVAVLMLVIAGFQLITARGEEDQLTKAKQSLLYAAIGIIVIVFAYVVVGIVVGGNV